MVVGWRWGGERQGQVRPRLPLRRGERGVPGGGCAVLHPLPFAQLAPQWHAAPWKLLRQAAAAPSCSAAPPLSANPLCQQQLAPPLPPRSQVLLRRFPKSHPFASLAGTENCISFTTLRYRWGRCTALLGWAAICLPAYRCQAVSRRSPLGPRTKALLPPPRGAQPACLLAPPCLHPWCSNPPLIVRGPGAGPAVTAAGVFGDLIALARYLGAPS